MFSDSHVEKGDEVNSRGLAELDSLCNTLPYRYKCGRGQLADVSQLETRKDAFGMFCLGCEANLFFIPGGRRKVNSESLASSYTM